MDSRPPPSGLATEVIVGDHSVVHLKSWTIPYYTTNHGPLCGPFRVVFDVGKMKMPHRAKNRTANCPNTEMVCYTGDAIHGLAPS
jgi:hypothetical protein